jgi:hypothetical protein
MTPERFEALAEAWGGDVSCWPDAEREAAAAWMAAEPTQAGVILARAADLDAALAAYAPARPSLGLAERIAAGAPKPRARRIGWLLPAGMGAGLAAACAAGMILGAQLSAAAAAASDDAVVAAMADEDVGFYLDEDAG